MEGRFQSVRGEEPPGDDTLAMGRALRERCARHHGVRIRDAAWVAAAERAVRFLRDRYMPDNASDLMPDAAAHRRVEMDSVPEVLDAFSRRQSCVRSRALPTRWAYESDRVRRVGRLQRRSQTPSRSSGAAPRGPRT